VEKLVAGGEGLARFEGIPVFVPRSAPGDLLRVRLTDRRPDYGRGEIVAVLEPGAGRREPPCPYFERCGGCDLQHLEDRAQSAYKAAAVVETLSRLGHVQLPAEPRLVTGAPWGYRLRAQLHADSWRGDDGETVAQVGYFARGSHDLVAVAACPILVPELEALLPSLPLRLQEGRGPREQPRRLDLAAGGTAGGGPERRAGTGVAESAVADAQISVAPMVEGLPHGEITLTVPVADGEDLVFGYDARCFFQAHRGLVGELMALAVGEWEGETAFDLYAGVGLFAVPLARRYRRVVAVEGDGPAARYARLNARRNKAEDLEVEHLAVESWIDELPVDADRVLVDPPRGGLARPVRRALVQRPPRRLTYVSCHPATLARDLDRLVNQGPFSIESVVLVDQFPQSGHMEAVVQLVREVQPAPQE